jgi:hypothetical protein
VSTATDTTETTKQRLERQRDKLQLRRQELAEIVESPLPHSTDPAKLGAHRRSIEKATAELGDVDDAVRVVDELLSAEYAREREAALAAARERSEKFRALEAATLEDVGRAFRALVDTIAAHQLVVHEHAQDWMVATGQMNAPHVLDVPLRNVEETIALAYVAAFRRDSGYNQQLAPFVDDLGDDARGVQRRARIDTSAPAGSFGALAHPNAWRQIDT